MTQRAQEDKTSQMTKEEVAEALRDAIERNDANSCLLALRILKDKGWNLNSWTFGRCVGLSWTFLQHAIMRSPGLGIIKCLVTAGADVNIARAGDKPLRDAVLCLGTPKTPGSNETQVERNQRENTPIAAFDTDAEATTKLERVRFLVEEARADLGKQGASALECALFRWNCLSPQSNALVTYLIRDCGVSPPIGDDIIRVLPEVASQQRRRVIQCLPQLEAASRSTVNIILEFLFTEPRSVLPRYKAWVHKQMPVWSKAEADRDIDHFSSLHSWYKHVKRPEVVYPCLMWGRQPSGNCGDDEPVGDRAHWWFLHQTDRGEGRAFIANEWYDRVPRDVWAVITKFPILLTRHGLDYERALPLLKAMWDELSAL